MPACASAIAMNKKRFDFYGCARMAQSVKRLSEVVSRLVIHTSAARRVSDMLAKKSSGDKNINI